MTPPNAYVGIRWTIGDVSDRGFEALRLSIWGAWHLFGTGAAYAVCHNSVPLGAARAKAGPLPQRVVWHDAGGELPGWLRPHFEAGMAEGVGWKFAPLRLFPDGFEIALDNDCILWAMPEAIRAMLAAPATQPRCVMAEDVRPAFGRFSPFCGPRPLNSGIRGLPPGFDLEAALRAMLEEASAAQGRRMVMTSELDEQGLQAAALSRSPGGLLVVGTEEVSICSPFWPHQPELGRCGAHFVGSNARSIAWDYYGRPADEWMREHWARHRPALLARTGAPPIAARDGGLAAE